MRNADRGQNIRLGVLINKDEMPSEKERQRFFAEFGHQHCFITKSRWNKFHVFSPTGTQKLSFTSLPVDFFYAPDHWRCRITDDQLRNVLLSLRHSPNDFLIVSASLSEFPVVEVSSMRNHTIFSKELGLDFPEGQGEKGVTGKILRLLPSDHAVTELNLEQLSGERLVTWAPEPCWPPRDPLLRIKARQHGPTASSNE